MFMKVIFTIVCCFIFSYHAENEITKSNVSIVTTTSAVLPVTNSEQINKSTKDEVIKTPNDNDNSTTKESNETKVDKASNKNEELTTTNQYIQTKNMQQSTNAETENIASRKSKKHKTIKHPEASDQPKISKSTQSSDSSKPTTNSENPQTSGNSKSTTVSLTKITSKSSEKANENDKTTIKSSENAIANDNEKNNDITNSESDTHSNSRSPERLDGKRITDESVDSSGSSHFMILIFFGLLFTILAYVGYQKRKKIMALVIEGRRRNGRERRGSGGKDAKVSYKPLDSEDKEAGISNYKYVY